MNKDLLEEFKHKFVPLCCEYCIYTPVSMPDFIISPKPILVRCSNNTCVKCKDEATSFYEHRVCYKCANEPLYPREYKYHHKNCIKIK